MVRSNNVLRKHPAFLRAARGAIEIYLHLDKNPYSLPVTNGNHTNGVLEGVKQKAEEGAKELAEKAKAAAEEAKKAVKPGQPKKAEEEEEDKPPAVVDDDPYGDKLASTKTPLDDVVKLVDQLALLGSDNPEAQELIFEASLYKSRLSTMRALTMPRR